MTVELLERSQGIPWNQLARFDTSLAALGGWGNQGRELTNKFMRLSAGLRKRAQGSEGQGMDPHWWVHEESFETVTGTAVTIEGAMQAFQDHCWIRLACHSAHHATKPFESWFAMRDGQLALMYIIQERYTRFEFASSSAYHTAAGDKSIPDGVIHLVVGMQFAGFSGVIGTLWRVDDSVTHQVVIRFYREIFKRPDIDIEHAAAAPNT